ncbi:hypothetical protein KC799_07515 [candidate division KSB1 bacterium]|nr:hypothetical protein [candidate division KSB1 bacterium]
MINLIRMSLLFFMIVAIACGQKEEAGKRKDCGVLEYDPINEASGIAAGRLNKDVLWTHNDSGDSSRIFAFSTTGKHLAEVTLKGTHNRDWEDIAIGPGPKDGVSYIYIGEIGDNGSRYATKYIYRIEEPKLEMGASPHKIVLENFDILAYQYPDSNRDAETLLVDPWNKDIYVVSKREEKVHVYRAAWPQSFELRSPGKVIYLEYITKLNNTWINGGDISANGKKILLKTQEHIFLWKRKKGESLKAAFHRDPVTLPYVPEPLGEAVCWSVDGKGYYTVSEEVNTVPAHLYYYKF